MKVEDVSDKYEYEVELKGCERKEVDLSVDLSGWPTCSSESGNFRQEARSASAIALPVL